MTPPFPNTPRPSVYLDADWTSSGRPRNGVHYVGDPVVLKLDDVVQDTAPATGLISSFESGLLGAELQTSDWGSRNNWTNVGSPAPLYDDTHVHAGSLSMKVLSGTLRGVFWDTALAAPIPEFFRFYLYATANPAGTVTIAGTANNLYFNITSTGKIMARDQPNTHSVTFATSIALNQWVRIEGMFNCTTGDVEFRLFNSPESTTPTETQTSSGWVFSASNNRFGVGAFIGTWSSDIWFDDVAGMADNWVGPLVGDPYPGSREYEIRNFYGEIISSGTAAYNPFTPSQPLNGWDPGWYRCYMTGTETDANFAASYGATNFCVIRDDSNFPTMPIASTSGGTDAAQDLVMKGVMGLGTSRLTVTDAAAPNIPNLQTDLAITRAYWADLPDTDRPAREPWVQFSGATSSGPQQAGVSAVVAALYPDCKYYEGPSNEPAMDAGTAADMATFAAAVHAGNANALAIGPCFVDITNLAGWDAFLAAGGGDDCDAISFHAYNAVTNGDLNLGRYTIQAFLDLLASYNLENKLLWQTESVHGFDSVYGIYHPRRARKALIEWMLFEQFGVPRERNNWWYDVSHGFWAFPSFSENDDTSLNPEAVLGRVFAEETWGKPFSYAIDFGTPGNNIFLGNVYEGAAGTTIALIATSYIPNASIRLNVSGAGSTVTVVDAFGNETGASTAQGVLVSVREVPSYVRLPAGASFSVGRINDWPLAGLDASSSPSATTKEIAGVSFPVIADDAFETNYANGTGIAPTPGVGEQGDTIDILWGAPQAITRVLIWCGPVWQFAGTLAEFTIQTTTDGINWTDQKTVTSTPSYFEFGTDSSNAGCFLETYWDEQWVFDVPLDEEVTAIGLRISVAQASYGGEPLSTTTYGAEFGQGTPAQAFRIQEVGVFSAQEAPVVRTGGGGPPKGERRAGDGEIVYESYIILAG